jgi:hypothetical protein
VKGSPSGTGCDRAPDLVGAWKNLSIEYRAPRAYIIQGLVLLFLFVAAIALVNQQLANRRRRASDRYSLTRSAPSDQPPLILSPTGSKTRPAAPAKSSKNVLVALPERLRRGPDRTGTTASTSDNSVIGGSGRSPHPLAAIDLPKPRDHLIILCTTDLKRTVSAPLTHNLFRRFPEALISIPCSLLRWLRWASLPPPQLSQSVSQALIPDSPELRPLPFRKAGTAVAHDTVAVPTPNVATSPVQAGGTDDHAADLLAGRKPQTPLRKRDRRSCSPYAMALLPSISRYSRNHREGLCTKIR